MIPEECKGEVMAALSNIESAFDGDEEIEQLKESAQFKFVKLGAQLMAEQLIEKREGFDATRKVTDEMANIAIRDLFDKFREYQARERRGEL